MSEKLILDACCGGRMFWFEKEHQNAIYVDNRTYDGELCDGRRFIVRPDVVADFRDLPFPDESFYMVVFDPPHLVRAGDDSWLRAKYGVLKDSWKQDLKYGFSECMRTLKPYGTLIFKWNECQISKKELLAAIGARPIIGNRRGKTIWMVFMKGLRCEDCGECPLYTEEADLDG